MSGFGAELRRRRTAAGLSLGQLAARTHYSKGHLCKVEQGTKPPSADLARLCDATLEAGGTLTALLPAHRPAGIPDRQAAAAPRPAEVAGLPLEPGPALRLAADLDATTALFRGIFDRCRDLGHQVSPVVVLETLVRQTGTLRSLAAMAGDPARRRAL